MRIYGTSDLTIPCQWTTIGKSIERLGHYLDCESKIISFEDLTRRKIDRDSDPVLFIFEAGNPQHAGLSMSDMKTYFPNSKFIALAADTIFYIKRGIDQLDLSLVDLFLDVSDIAIDHYAPRGIKVDTWIWSISEWLIEKCEETRNGDGSFIGISKDIDFIGVYHPGTLHSGYRGTMIKYLSDNGYSFSNGGGNGHHDNDMDRLLKYYQRSKFTLGTTSHMDQTVRGMKGMRDALGCFTDSLLIYDDYREVIERFSESIPIYGYGKFDEIVSIARYFEKNQTHKQVLLERQREWYRKNTIENQLLNLLGKHNIL